MYESELRKLSLVARFDLLREEAGGALESLGGIPDDNPVYVNAPLRGHLRKMAASQDYPALMKDDFEVYFASLLVGDCFYYIGPMCTVRQEKIQERRFYHSYGIDPEDVRPLRFFTLQEVLYIVELVAEGLTGKTYQETELLYRNHIACFGMDALKAEQAVFVLDEEDVNEEEETWRHTYREERKILDAVKEGRVEDALQLSRLLDEDTGRLSDRDLNHWRNLAIVGITLSSRAAIEGGLSPQSAYRISGYYIRKCDEQTSVTQMLGMRDYAIRDLTTRVREKLEGKQTSRYTEVCKTYIIRHYREKLYLEEIAEHLGISPAYLSRLFKKNTGIRLQDYIVRVRVERAANLLRYSDQSLSNIAQYVNFPSQSYLGKAFKKEMHMTPMEYRNRYQVAEWEDAQK